MPDSGDDDKSGYSNAFKRAAVKFGVGRYLYRDGVPAFVREAPPASPEPAGQQQAQQQQAQPGLPPVSRPEPPRAPELSRPEEARPSQPAGNGKPPRSGRALFAWTKDMEQKHEIGLLKYLNSWAKLQDFPNRMVDWDADQVSQGYAEAIRKIQSLSSGGPEA